jgi:hypothetical protein
MAGACPNDPCVCEVVGRTRCIHSPMNGLHDCTVCSAAPGIWRSKADVDYYACDDCFADKAGTSNGQIDRER